MHALGKHEKCALEFGAWLILPFCFDFLIQEKDIIPQHNNCLGPSHSTIVQYEKGEDQYAHHSFARESRTTAHRTPGAHSLR
jgi:hypothetical protein